MYLENSKVFFGFSKNGSLIKIINKETNNVFIDKEDARSIELLIDKKTSDIWESRPYSLEAVRIDLSKINADIQKNTLDNGEELVITQIVTIDGINGDVKVSQRVLLEKDASLIKCNYEFVNNLEKGVLVSASILVDGLFEKAFKDEKDGSQIRSDIAFNYMMVGDNDMLTEKKLVSGYPIPCSVQFFTIYNQTDSFYFGYHDKLSTYKQFSFEKVGNVGMVVWPFISKGGTFVVDPVYMGCFNGDWHEGGDYYYDWLVEKSGKMRKYSNLAKNFKGMACFQAGSYPDIYHLKYVKDAPQKTVLAPADVRSRCINTDNVGTNITTFCEAGEYAMKNSYLDTSLFMGWHRGGFDTYYPDYEILDELGGKEGLRQCFEDMHNKGLKALIYTNIHLADTTGKWFNVVEENGKKKGENSAVLKGNGEFFYERYPHTTPNKYVAMCPKDINWQTKIIEVIEGVRALGADGAFFDQVMTNPAFLCYNKNHGHKTPATAFEEGYQEMLTKINEAYAKYGDDFEFCCEGIGDAYMNQIDIMGMLWFRKWGDARAPHLKPQVLRYCIPGIVLGMQSYGEIGDNLYAYAFCMFAPPMTYPYIYDLTRRWVKLNEKYPEIYLRGRFLDNLGITNLPENVRLGVCIADDKKSAMIHIFNANMNKTQFNIKIDKTKWKKNLINDKFKVVNAENGKKIKGKDGVYSFVMDGKGKLALLVK